MTQKSELTEVERIDLITDYLYDVLDMGGASTYKTRLLLEFIASLDTQGSPAADDIERGGAQPTREGRPPTSLRPDVSG